MPKAFLITNSENPGKAWVMGSHVNFKELTKIRARTPFGVMLVHIRLK